MEFGLLGKGVSVDRAHVFLVIAALVLMAAVVTVLGSIYAFMLPSDPSSGFWENVAWSSVLLITVVQLIALPLSAFLFLKMAPLFKLETDVPFCRSCAAANYVVSVAFSLLAIILGYGLGVYYFAGLILIEVIGSLIRPAAASFLIYLWMLLLRKPDMRRINEAAAFAVVFAAAMFLIWQSYTFFTFLGTGLVYRVELDPSHLWSFIGDMLLAVVLLYHIPKKLDDAAYLFAGLFLAPYIFFMIAEPLLDWMVSMTASPWIAPTYTILGLGTQFADAALSLLIIWILGRQIHRGKASE